MTRLTKPMLRLILDLHDAPNGKLPSASVPAGTARALVSRGFAAWTTDKSTAGWPTYLVLQGRGRMVLSRALGAGSVSLTRSAA